MVRYLTTKLPLFSLIWLGFALRLHQVGQPSLWFDELLQLDLAQGPFWQIWPRLHQHAAMPLDYIISAGWITLGRQEWWVRFPAVACGLLAIPACYTLGRRMVNARVGILAATLLTISSFAIRYSQEVRPYALLMFLVLVAHIGLWRAYQTKQPHYWILAIVGMLGAILSHYFALFLLLPWGLFVARQQLFHLHNRIYWQQTACFGLLLALLLSGILISGRTRVLYNIGSRYAREVSQPETFTRPPTERPNKGTGPGLDRASLANNILIPLSSSDKPLLLVYMAFFSIGILSIIGRSGRSPQQRQAILLLLAWLWLPIILIYLFLVQRGTFFAIRYILYTLPAYLLIVASGLDYLLEWGWERLKIVILTDEAKATHSLYPTFYLLLLAPLLFAEGGDLLQHYTTPPYEDWRSVGQLLTANATSDDAVIALRTEPTMNWYYPPAQAPQHYYNRSQTLLNAINEHPRRWIILSSYSRRVDENLRTWLDAQGAVMIGIDQRVVVYFHQEGLSTAEMLAVVKTFQLPPNPLTYQTLADQFLAIGDVETAEGFYEVVEGK